MFCRNCGKESDGVKKFCTNCGTALVSEAPKASSPTPQPVIRPPMPKEPWTAGRVTKTLLIIAFVAGIIILRAVNTVDSVAVDKNNSALSAFDSGNSDQAITQFQEASKSAVGSETKIPTLVNLAYVYSSEGKSELALSTFKEALGLASGSTFSYYLISGEIAELENRPAAAYENYNKAYAMKPDDFQVNNSLALFHLDMESAHPKYEDYKKALLYAQKAYGLNNSEVTRQNLGIAQYWNKNYDASIALLTQTNISQHPYVGFWIGFNYIAKEDVEKAKYYFRQAIAAGGDAPQEVTDYLNSN